STWGLPILKQGPSPISSRTWSKRSGPVKIHLFYPGQIPVPELYKGSPAVAYLVLLLHRHLAHREFPVRKYGIVAEAVDALFLCLYLSPPDACKGHGLLAGLAVADHRAE